MGKLIRVGMADMNICKAPDRIITLGLGSCVGLVLFDIKTSVCGMLHVMLPDSSISKKTDNPAKFADTGVEKLIEELRKNGVPSRNLMAKMAGGARMFAFQGNGDFLKIGERNAEAVKTILGKKGIPIIASDCGGTYGRTIEFDPVTYKLHIRAIGKPEKAI